MKGEDIMKSLLKKVEDLETINAKVMDANSILSAKVEYLESPDHVLTIPLSSNAPSPWKVLSSSLGQYHSSTTSAMQVGGGVLIKSSHFTSDRSDQAMAFVPGVTLKLEERVE